MNPMEIHERLERHLKEGLLPQEPAQIGVPPSEGESTGAMDVPEGTYERNDDGIWTRTGDFDFEDMRRNHHVIASAVDEDGNPTGVVMPDGERRTHAELAMFQVCQALVSSFLDEDAWRKVHNGSATQDEWRAQFYDETVPDLEARTLLVMKHEIERGWLTAQEKKSTSNSGQRAKTEATIAFRKAMRWIDSLITEKL